VSRDGKPYVGGRPVDTQARLERARAILSSTLSVPASLEAPGSSDRVGL
jgi:hypothetical protein